MPEIEKVISHLRIIRTWAEVDGERGRGIEPKCCADIVKWLDEALNALKVQQPRLMTLEELDDLRGRGQSVYYEDREASAKCQDMFLVTDNEWNDTAWLKGEVYTLVAAMSKYGRTWRCWTSRPDEKVRAETPWDDLGGIAMAT